MRRRWDEALRLGLSISEMSTKLFRGRDAARAVVADAQDQLGHPDEAIATTRLGIAERPHVASHHVNLALLEGRDLTVAKHMNPWIDSSVVLRAGARPSIFVQQDCILGRYRLP